MTEKNYYTQIISSFIKQNTSKESTLCLSDDISKENLGKYISAMSNTAAIKKVPYFYAFWGIDQNSKELTDTKYSVPNQQELSAHLSSNAIFSIVESHLNEKRTVVLEVQCAYDNTIQYDGYEYILYNGKISILDKFPDKAKKLWKLIYSNSQKSFDTDIALENISASEIDKYLDCQKLFQMLQKPFPKSSLNVIAVLSELRFITEENTGKYNITNLGALLLARRLSIFKSIEYKAIRVLVYSGNNLTQPAREQVGAKGYIVGFEGLIKYIDNHLPQIEYIDGALRKKRSMFPMLSIRELVANAIIHQDLTEKGAPIISIFEDHIVISNPGVPIIEKNRFIDTPPYSRNESLASAMHKVGICEERGSGYDKVISFIEENNLPAPEITVHDRRTSVTLRCEKAFDDLTKDELIQICYNHTCLNYVQGKITNNSSLRSRFGLEENDRYKISRIFDATITAKLIKKKENTGPKNREYIPYWV